MGISVKRNGISVRYDSLEDVLVDASRSLGLTIWRETIESCQNSDAQWVDLISDLHDSGGKHEEESLLEMFKDSSMRRWVLVALVLNGLTDEKFIEAIANATSEKYEGLISWLTEFRMKAHDSDAAFVQGELDHWQRIVDARCAEDRRAVARAAQKRAKRERAAAARVKAEKERKEKNTERAGKKRIQRESERQTVARAKAAQVMMEQERKKREGRIASATSTVPHERQIKRSSNEVEGLYVKGRWLGFVRPRGNGWTLFPQTFNLFGTPTIGVIVSQDERVRVNIRYNVFGDGQYYCERSDVRPKAQIDVDAPLKNGLYLDGHWVGHVLKRGEGWTLEDGRPTSRECSKLSGMVVFGGKSLLVNVEYNTFGDAKYYCRRR